MEIVSSVPRHRVCVLAGLAVCGRYRARSVGGLGFFRVKFSDLQVAVVDGAPAVRGLGRLLAGVEKAAEFAVEACAGDDELHT